MSDSSFHRFAGACAILAAAALFAFALGALAAGVDHPAAAPLRRLDGTAGGYLLAAYGLLATPAVVALYLRLRDTAEGWSTWAAALGLLGAAMTAAHGLWDALRRPVLAAQWESGIPGRQEAIAAFTGVPNPVDPRGLGALLMLGAFALVAGRLAPPGGALPRRVGTLGTVLGATMILAFLIGLAGPSPARQALGGLAVGVLGPLWWAGVGRVLLAR